MAQGFLERSLFLSNPGRSQFLRSLYLISDVHNKNVDMLKTVQDFCDVTIVSNDYM